MLASLRRDVIRWYENATNEEPGDAPAIPTDTKQSARTSTPPMRPFDVNVAHQTSTSSLPELKTAARGGAPARLDQLIGDESGERCAVEHEERGRGIPSRARAYGDVAIVADWYFVAQACSDAERSSMCRVGVALTCEGARSVGRERASAPAILHARSLGDPSARVGVVDDVADTERSQRARSMEEGSGGQRRRWMRYEGWRALDVDGEIATDG
ncbi:hypothetical protein EYR36_003236 [Pleurotus pulmonarius]|nr:hypothetical protein EYR36_003236 [Pleurotus pulmonarius]